MAQTCDARRRLTLALTLGLAVVAMGCDDAEADAAGSRESDDDAQQEERAMDPAVRDGGRTSPAGESDAGVAKGERELRDGAAARLDARVAPTDAVAEAQPGAAHDGSIEPSDASAPTAPVCTDTSLRVGDNRATLEHLGRRRSYIVYVPSGVDGASAVPLVLDFHGNGGSASQQQGSSGWREKADREKFLVVYPEGVGNAWNVGNCCGQALSGKVDDVGFARALIEAVSRAGCVDPKRVYVTGLSNGAGLAHRIACEAADVVAAIAAASADLVTDPCTPARPISELSVRGTRDTLVAYEGGNTGSTGWYSPGAKGTLALWKDINGCTGEPEMKREHCETYAQCRAGVEVTLCSLPGAGHILYRNSLGFSVPDVAWEMFERQRLP